MSFFLARPYCLVFILAAIPLFLYWKKRLTSSPAWHSGAIFALRAGVVALLVLALAGPIVTWRNFTKYVVFAVDGSGSVADASESGRFMEAALATQGKNEAVTLHFARNITPDAAACDGTATNLASALTAAAAVAPEDYVPRVVLFSDGTYTQGGEPAKVADDVPLDVVFLPTLPGDGGQEMWIERISAPRAGYAGQVVGVDVFIRAQGVPSDGKTVTQGNIRLLRNGEPVETQAVTFEADGVRGVRFQAAVKSPDAPPTKDAAPEPVQWRVELSPEKPEQDVCAENNVAEALTQVAEHQRILLVERTPGFGRMIEDTLRKQFITVESCPVEGMPMTAKALRPYGLVLMTNIPVSMIPEAGMAALHTYVTRDGGGLMVIGGDQAFTSGGYHETPLEELLPVVCVENKEGRKREGLGLMLVVDRSESMKDGDAISLAREAVKKAVDILGEQDQVGVLAYGDATVWLGRIAPLTETHKAEMFAKVDALTAISTTNMAPAMEKAMMALKEISADRKHIILMSDGISNPGDFAGIAEKCREAGITISTVALGEEAGPELLADIAKIGGGKAYICTDAESLPQIFARETAEAAKLGIIEGQTPVRQISSIPGFMNFDFTQVPPLLGYVQTRAKADCRVIFESPANDPILAWWRAGQGRVVAFTSDMESHWVETWRSGWADFDRFWARLINHAIRSGDDDLQLQVAYDDTWMNVSVTVPPGRDLAGYTLEVSEAGGASPVMKVVLENVAPGLYAARVRVKPGARYDLALCEPGATAATSYMKLSTVANFTQEYRPDRQKPARETLETIVRETGGAINPQPASVFAKNTGADALFVAQTLPFWPFLVFFAILAWLAELFLRRTG